LDDRPAQLTHVFVLFLIHGNLHEGHQDGRVHGEDLLSGHLRAFGNRLDHVEQEIENVIDSILLIETQENATEQVAHL